MTGSDRVWSCNVTKDEAPRTVFKSGCDVGGATVSEIDDKFYMIAREKDRDDDPVWP